ncbi:hypothetical protein JTE90_009741 [Oedothorax gibbosus]|uniref:Uncharacterized protein n=1 Tax=Oedothorax gibbosus TaxID=931172 RepID=A0AAV6VA44_9ARAC|nr:hypothetical protein JTE90_009741 [Oedothorax gibbosus]
MYHLWQKLEVDAASRKNGTLSGILIFLSSSTRTSFAASNQNEAWRPLLLSGMPAALVEDHASGGHALLEGPHSFSTVVGGAVFAMET